jgi:hypothetical protein
VGCVERVETCAALLAHVYFCMVGSGDGDRLPEPGSCCGVSTVLGPLGQVLSATQPWCRPLAGIHNCSGWWVAGGVGSSIAPCCSFGHKDWTSSEPALLLPAPRAAGFPPWPQVAQQPHSYLPKQVVDSPPANVYTGRCWKNRLKRRW